jgi:hypothetical protein
MEILENLSKKWKLKRSINIREKSTKLFNSYILKNKSKKAFFDKLVMMNGNFDVHLCDELRNKILREVGHVRGD